MIEDQLVYCLDEFVVGNLTVSLTYGEVTVEVSALVRVPKNPLSYSIRYARSGTVCSEGVPHVMEVRPGLRVLFTRLIANSMQSFVIGRAASWDENWPQILNEACGSDPEADRRPG